MNFYHGLALGLLLGGAATFMILGWAFSRMGVEPVRAEWAIALTLAALALWIGG